RRSSGAPACATCACSVPARAATRRSSGATGARARAPAATSPTSGARPERTRAGRSPRDVAAAEAARVAAEGAELPARGRDVVAAAPPDRRDETARAQAVAEGEHALGARRHHALAEHRVGV